MLKLGQFMDGLAMNESNNNYDYFSSGPDSKAETRDDLLGRFSIRRYNWDDWSTAHYGAIRDWHNHEHQDSVALDIFKDLFDKYRLQFPDETTMQIYQRLAAWWKLPSFANDTYPKSAWSGGLKSYVYKVGQKINALGYEGWGHEGHLA